MVEKDHDGATARVTFTVPPEASAATACVVGEFNDWSTTEHEMAPEGGGFALTLDLPAGRMYRFRYLLDGHRWENDWAADAYVPNEFGGDDSVIDLTDAAPAPPTDPTSKPRRTRTKASKASKASTN